MQQPSSLGIGISVIDLFLTHSYMKHLGKEATPSGVNLHPFMETAMDA